MLLQLGFMRRFDPEFAAAAERIQAGEIGRPMMIKSLTHGPGLPPAWARDLSTSNGMLAEVNSHDWDCVRWLMGANLERVYTEVANFKGAAQGVDTPHFYDNALVNIRFESGGLGSISGICPCDYGYDARVEIIGERGIMQIGEHAGPGRGGLHRPRAGHGHPCLPHLARSASPGATFVRWSTSSIASDRNARPVWGAKMAAGRWQVSWPAHVPFSRSVPSA